MEWKEDLGTVAKSQQANGALPRTAPRATTAGSPGRQPGDIQE